MNFVLFISVFIACLVYVECLGIGRKQSAGVRGVLLCDGKAASNVKLYDDDRGLDTDDLMAHGQTDTEGHFQLKGYTHEITTIDPNKYVFSGETPEQYYNLGVLELSGKFSGESRDCIH